MCDQRVLWTGRRANVYVDVTKELCSKIVLHNLSEPFRGSGMGRWNWQVYGTVRYCFHQPSCFTLLYFEDKTPGS